MYNHGLEVGIFDTQMSLGCWKIQYIFIASLENLKVGEILSCPTYFLEILISMMTKN